MNILKSVRVWVMITAVVLSLLMVFNIIPMNKGEEITFGNGLDYGLDFAGGIQMQLKLDRPLDDANTMAVEKGILENRLNAMGLKDIVIRPWGNQYILLEIASASPSDIARIEDILKQQARFEARIDGELAISGSDISIDLSPEGRGVSRSEPSEWYVAITNSMAGGESFCRVGKDKRNKPIDMFLDRPENTFFLMDNGTYSILKELRGADLASYVKIIENRSLIPIVVALNDTLNMSRVSSLKESGFDQAIILEEEDRVSNRMRNELEENGIKTERRAKGNESYEEWVMDIIGLQSSPVLRCDPCSQCKYSAIITGQASTYQAAEEDMRSTQILLGSGNLPAKATIESKSEVPASLGGEFLRYSFIIGILAVFTVALVVFLRYKRLEMVVPIMVTSLSEIIIILGVASLISWELDLPAVAGIIAAVGTGVDHQIIITDESISRRHGEQKKKLVSLVERIKRAFFIIFVSAATTIAVMIPVFLIQSLKGFALTTAVGVFIGITITRPAYAKIIEGILKR